MDCCCAQFKQMISESAHAWTINQSELVGADSQHLNEVLPAQLQLDISLGGLSGHHRRKCSIARFFECDEEAKFMVMIAKFIIIFNIRLQTLGQLRHQLNNKEKSYIQDFTSERTLADTNRRQFVKYFSKTHEPAVNIMGATNIHTHTPQTGGLMIIIQQKKQSEVAGDIQEDAMKKNTNSTTEQPKYQLKLLNQQCFIHSVLANIKIDDSQVISLCEKKYMKSYSDDFIYLDKVLNVRYKKISHVVCYERVESRNLRSKMFEFLVKKFKEVVYIAHTGEFITNNSNVQNMICRLKSQTKPEDCLKQESGQPEIQYTNKQLQVQPALNFQQHLLQMPSRIKFEGVISVENNQDTQSPKYIKAYMSQQVLALSSCNLSSKALQNYQQFYNQYTQQNKSIEQLLITSQITRDVFYSNQVCISFYGALFNFITHQMLTHEPIADILLRFLDYLVAEKNKLRTDLEARKQKRPVARKLGHYPVKIDKGSKVCCVCELLKKKKSRFKCEKCSETYSRDIALCIDHFKEYHENVHLYIPKGVKRGARQNQILLYNEKIEGSGPAQTSPNSRDTKSTGRDDQNQMLKEEKGKSANQILAHWRQQIESGCILYQFENKLWDRLIKKPRGTLPLDTAAIKVQDSHLHSWPHINAYMRYLSESGCYFNSQNEMYNGFNQHMNPEMVQDNYDLNYVHYPPCYPHPQPFPFLGAHSIMLPPPIKSEQQSSDKAATGFNSQKQQELK